MAEDDNELTETPDARRRMGCGCLIALLLVLGLAYVFGSNLRKWDPGGGPDPEVGVPGGTMNDGIPRGGPGAPGVVLA